jgi:hypothetical protein
MPHVWIFCSVQSQNSAGLICETVCVPIIIVHLLENNKTRKWERKEKMWLKDWLEKRSEFRYDNLPRELEINFATKLQSLFMNLSFCSFVNHWKLLLLLFKGIHDYGRLLCNTSNEIIHYQRYLYVRCTNCFIGCRLCHMNTNLMLCMK